MLHPLWLDYCISHNMCCHSIIVLATWSWNKISKINAIITEMPAGVDFERDIVTCPVAFGGVLLFTNFTPHQRSLWTLLCFCLFNIDIETGLFFIVQLRDCCFSFQTQCYLNLVSSVKYGLLNIVLQLSFIMKIFRLIRTHEITRV